MAQEYTVVVLSSVVETISALSKGEQRQVLRQLRKLERGPALGQSMGHHSLDLSGCRRVVAGRLRIVYEVEEPTRTVTVLAVGAREGKTVYEIAAAELGRQRLHRIS